MSAENQMLQAELVMLKAENEQLKAENKKLKDAWRKLGVTGTGLPNTNLNVNVEVEREYVTKSFRKISGEEWARMQDGILAIRKERRGTNDGPKRVPNFWRSLWESL